MIDPKNLLLAGLLIITAAYVAFWFNFARHRRREGTAAAGPVGIAIDVVTNFFDTLGIGSFATTTTMRRLAGVVLFRLADRRPAGI